MVPAVGHVTGNGRIKFDKSYESYIEYLILIVTVFVVVKSCMSNCPYGKDDNMLRCSRLIKR